MITINRVTISDIARRLDVSANTVSKALNGKEKVSEQLRAKIIETAEKMGYEKNVNASRLSQKTVNIGVLIYGYDVNYYRYSEKGYTRAAEYLADRRVKVTVKVVPHHNGVKTAMGVLNEFSEAGFEGVIIDNFYSEEIFPILEQYRKKGIQYAFSNHDIPEVERKFAVTNDYACAAGLAAQMLSLCVDRDKALAVYMHCDVSYGQLQLMKCFCDVAKEHGFSRFIISSDLDEILSDDNQELPGGIYVSHASYMELCRKAEVIWKEKELPKIIASDLYEDCVPYLERGTVTAIIYQEPEEQAFLAVVKLCECICEGKMPESVLTIKPVLIMKSNYKKYM